MADYLTDEEQVDRLKRLIKKYGGSVLTGILLALIAYFGWSYWQKKQQSEQAILSAQYQKLVDAGKSASANPTDTAARTKFLAEANQLVKANADSPYAFQTLLLQAKVAADREDYAAAEKALTSAVSAPIDDQGLQQLAYLRLARVQFQLGKNDAAQASLKKVTDAAFIPSAFELQGDILVQKNDVVGAKKAYQQAWDALAKRLELRQLLKVKMEALGMTVTDIVPASPLRSEGAPS